ncbi:hypothetical protein MJO28_006326 [Puccinia striiformis f. sp. tritici]|uniref:Uncharacterized protein n=1 Tax=Puccinia striiformis f. sp. tritici TaxID=168172 RepID=A0ACC0EHW6_9BASI|nr:hypothetical protein MJO28_006326 [Puccinia striiformis f. sp. tritici]
MKVVNEARNTKKHEYNPRDGFIRRYHSVTSEDDKQQTLEDFGNDKVPVISSTMALGLGQNLKRVRCVIHMGRGDPAAIVQMVGRCGRDGNVGLGILFMERTRKNGRNSVADFAGVKHQNDDGRMDALAVTLCCLRIAMTVDNKVGYIPLTEDDPNFKAERTREESKGFTKCLCLTCAPEEAKALIERIQQMNRSNFNAFLKNPYTFEKDPSIVTMIRKRKKQSHKGSCGLPEHLAFDLIQHLSYRFEIFYYDFLGPLAEFPPAVFFGINKAKIIVDSFNQMRAGVFHDTSLLDKLIGGQCFEGQIACLNQAITNWMGGELYQHHLIYMAELNRFIEAEGQQVRDEMAEKYIILQAKAEASRQAIQLAKEVAAAEEKSRKAEARATERLRVAEDRAKEKAMIAAERAAERQHVAEQKKATKALEKARRKAEQVA